ncbi:MAG: hypothetical protein HXY30_08960 [Pseudorhodoplanes sp.]|nr:hypothetical protein [Pseudorhodoplanes sp.]
MTDDKPGKPEQPMTMHQNPQKDGARLSKEIQARIGQQLRSMYDDVVKEGVPSRFAALIEQIENSDDQPKDTDSSKGSRG